ncbi:MAG: hypothetical protein IIC70_07330, partial [Acidobacteria bacterium]|nr:hypothetical protein [Acidobacteriota bacterium]
MIQGLLNSTAVPLLEQVVRFSERRQRLLAGNVTNIDTPNYKTRDLPVEQFRQALKDAVAAQQNGPPAGGLLSAGASANKSIEQFFPEELFQPVLASPQNITFQDGNNRSIEKTVMDMRKNVAM